MTIDSALDSFRLDSHFMSGVTAWERQPARPARYGSVPDDLHPDLVTALRQRDWLPLYTHQSDAIAAALRGEDLVLVSGTASGKTLAYTLPILHTLLTDLGSRALCLFPTKALSQDQAVAFNRLLADLDTGHIARTYDGDTPRGQRPGIRTTADIVITNPDMLHAGILPHHTPWASFFANLRYIVLDELHTYRGIFGSHVANLLRRLRRICAFYGSQPQFICTSATIANPQQLAESLLERPVTLIDNDGAPRSEKHVILYTPPLLDAATGLHRAYTLETQQFAARFLADDVQTVVFARARVTTELLLNYIRRAAADRALPPESIRGYRGGYLPNERREIESGLRNGTVRAVVATNALELGVDIGQLGAAIIAGYPGGISSFWQQAGRVGRRADASAVILVASAAPLDQYIARHPRYLFETSPERALINPNNLTLLYNHVRCAAFELPFKPGEGFGQFEHLSDLLDLMVEQGELHPGTVSHRWIGDSNPAHAISLRTSTADRVLIHDITTEPAVLIGEVDVETAPVLVHHGAIYTHEGQTYHVEQLDWDEKVAYVKSTTVDYYTRASEAVTLEVLTVFDADESAPARRAYGEVMVTSQPSGYKQIKLYTHEVLGFGEIHLPPRQYQTTAYWLWIDPDTARRLERENVLTRPLYYGPNWETQRNAARHRDGYACRECGAAEPPDRQHHVHHIQPFRTFGYSPGENDAYKLANALDNLLTLCPTCHIRLETAERKQSALSGLGHVLTNLAPLYLMCDPADLALLVEQRRPDTGAPTITLYERLPDGVGLSAQLYDLHHTLLTEAHALIRTCPCETGCPACIGPESLLLDQSDTKQLTLLLIQALLGG